MIGKDKLDSMGRLNIGQDKGIAIAWRLLNVQHPNFLWILLYQLETLWRRRKIILFILIILGVPIERPLKLSFHIYFMPATQSSSCAERKSTHFELSLFWPAIGWNLQSANSRPWLTWIFLDSSMKSPLWPLLWLDLYAKWFLEYNILELWGKLLPTVLLCNWLTDRRTYRQADNQADRKRKKRKKKKKMKKRKKMKKTKNEGS